MCGIAGGIGFSEHNLKNVSSSIKHRGPDSDGVFVDESDGEITGVGRENLESGGFFFAFSSPLREIIHELFGIVKVLNCLRKAFAQIMTEILEVLVII